MITSPFKIFRSDFSNDFTILFNWMHDKFCIKLRWNMTVMNCCLKFSLTYSTGPVILLFCVPNHYFCRLTWAIKLNRALVWNGKPPASIYQLKVNNRNTRTGCEICSKLTIKTRQWCRSGVCIINFEHISLLVPLFLLLTFNMKFPAGPSHANRWSINWKMSKIARGDFTWVKTKLHFQ